MFRAVCMAVVLLFCFDSNAVEKELYDQQVDEIDESIFHLVSDSPARTLYKNAKYRRRLARDIVKAANEYGVSPHLVTATAFIEGSFRRNAYGKRGETTMMQVKGPLRDMCVAKRMNLSRQRDQLRCGSRWLSHHYRLCGSWPAAMTKYMSGSCVSPSKRTNKAVQRRMDLWMNLMERSAYAVSINDEDVDFVSVLDIRGEVESDPYEIPKRLSNDVVRDILKKYIRYFYKCGPVPGDKIVLNLLVKGATGKINRAEIVSDGGRMSLGLCVRRSVMQMRFPPFQHPWIDIIVTITF